MRVLTRKGWRDYRVARGDSQRATSILSSRRHDLVNALNRPNDICRGWNLMHQPLLSSPHPLPNTLRSRAAAWQPAKTSSSSRRLCSASAFTFCLRPLQTACASFLTLPWYPLRHPPAITTTTGTTTITIYHRRRLRKWDNFVTVALESSRLSRSRPFSQDRRAHAFASACWRCANLWRQWPKLTTLEGRCGIGFLYLYIDANWWQK